MKTWIVTGGAASGKSSFCDALQEFCPCLEFISSDKIVHGLLAEADVVDAVSRLYGPSVTSPDGAINRHALRERVFGNDEARRDLESLLHPRVFERIQKARNEAAARRAQLFVAEIPLFYESNRAYPADLVILIATSGAHQQRRMVEERKLDAQTAARILAAQMPLERKIELAPVVVWNDGVPELLRSQARLLVEQLEKDS